MVGFDLLKEVYTSKIGQIPSKNSFLASQIYKSS
jgi:hypothetical protein